MKIKTTIRALGVIALIGYSAVGCTTVPQPVSGVAKSNTSTCRNARPPYPPAALALGQQGRVKAEVLIAADGTYLKGKVRKSSGSDLLDAATLAAASSWCWKPKYVNGVAVEAWQEFEYVWALE